MGRHHRHVVAAHVLLAIALGAVPAHGFAQFVDSAAPQIVRLPPVWLERPATLPPQAAPAVSPIPAWMGNSRSPIAAAEFQSNPAEPVVEAVQIPAAPAAPSTALPPISSPERYFQGYDVPPRSGHITAPEDIYHIPPDPEELDSCNLPRQHQRAMIDLMGNNELLISAGTVSPIGDQQLDNHLLTGWGIQGAVRHIWCMSTDTWVPFSEFGGGFAENGAIRSYVTTSGYLIDSEPLGATTSYFLEDFYQSTLRDLRRATIHAALGAYYLPRRWQQPGVRAVQFNARGGLHWGHARATFQQVPTGDLEALVAALVAGGASPENLTTQTNIDLSDSYFGMFTSLGVSYNRFNVVFGCFEFGEVAIGIDVQYTHEWISLKDYNDGSRGLSTLAPMATFRILY